MTANQSGVREAGRLEENVGGGVRHLSILLLNHHGRFGATQEKCRVKLPNQAGGAKNLPTPSWQPTGPEQQGAA